MTETTLTIGELAKQGSVATSLLRYYEKEGLLEPVGRTAAGYRLYSHDSVRHLRFIRKAQRYGPLAIHSQSTALRFLTQ